MTLTDKTLVCGDCGQEFTFSAGEQEFFASRGLQNEPKRCPQCRSSRRAARGEGGGSSPRQAHTAICAACGVETTVPFEPRQDRPVYCKDCYTKMKRPS